ncbi:MAG: radical SAM protein [Spirochaetales bacterium]|nr:radical SAM protein [Spirochaetales bacterium]
MIETETKTEKTSCGCSSPDAYRRYEEYIYAGLTRSVCDKCYDEFLNSGKKTPLPIVDAEILFKDNKVYLKKYCPKHGYTMALKSSDLNWYKKVWDPFYLRRGTPPIETLTKREDGCPYDCGICPDHHQHICVPLLDITDACNLNCNICLASNKKNPTFISLEDFENRIDTVLSTEGSVQSLVLSGGEPSLHPDLLKLFEAVKKRKNIARIAFNTNGLLIARDEDFVKKLKDYDVYVNLSFDGFDDEIYEKTRGIKKAAAWKQKAIEYCAKYNIRMCLVSAIAKGINEDQPAKIINTYIQWENIINITLQPLILVGQGGYKLDADPMDRITMPDIMKGIEKGTDGLIREDDFSMIPCAHGECQIVCYLYINKKRKRITPYSRLLSRKDYLNAIKNEPFIRPEVFRDIILKRSKSGPGNDDSAYGDVVDMELMNEFEQNNKQIFLHHFMDVYNFDIGRVKRCCNLYLTGDGKQIPACWYNIYYRNLNR